MSYSGLTAEQQALARRHMVLACELLLLHADAVHYSKGTNRWQGIASRLIAAHGHFPDYGDCSSTVSWVLWNALHYHFGRGDIVSGNQWAWGNTTTMMRRGVTVASLSDLRVGDCVFYQNHVVLALGGGMAFSHGSERGPFKVPVTYRTDFVGAKRYL